MLGASLSGPACWLRIVKIAAPPRAGLARAAAPPRQKSLSTAEICRRGSFAAAICGHGPSSRPGCPVLVALQSRPVDTRHGLKLSARQAGRPARYVATPRAGRIAAANADLHIDYYRSRVPLAAPPFRARALAPRPRWRAQNSTLPAELERRRRRRWPPRPASVAPPMDVRTKWRPSKLQAQCARPILLVSRPSGPTAAAI
jgi:hypothetical protein